MNRGAARLLTKRLGGEGKRSPQKECISHHTRRTFCSFSGFGLVLNSLNPGLTRSRFDSFLPADLVERDPSDEVGTLERAKG